MATSYLPVDRDQLFLLPEDMREWLPKGHLAFFVLDVVRRIDLSALHARHNHGPGRRGYDPEMVLALLFYAYCTGVRSSRRIEQLCWVDVAFRVVCAGQPPDHSTIARFRQDSEGVAEEVFADVLALCAAAGLAQVGVVAVDGTKMKADASMGANRARAHIEAEVAQMFAEAGRADQEEGRLFGPARGDELPPALADPRSRGAHLDRALAELAAQRASRLAAEQAARWAQGQKTAARQQRGGRAPDGRPPAHRELELAQKAVGREQARAAERARQRAVKEAEAAAKGGTVPGRRPGTAERYALSKARRRLQKAEQAAAHKAVAPVAQAPRKVNTTDPDSRVMVASFGFVQAYNAQAAVNELGLVLAAEVTQDTKDCAWCVPMMAAAQANLAGAGVDEPIGTLLFDAGYWTIANASAAGPDRLIATTKGTKLKKRTKDEGFRSGPPPPGATPATVMEHRLLTREGQALYAKRGTTVEPFFGQVKHNRGFRGFVRRGLRAAAAEWKFITATHNALKLFNKKAAFTF